ncbi:flagellar protein FlgN [Undibacterium sp.]|jgi:flagella synthesis protein FlgN|uniref:flagella synthesis protein FlgN n=1 Tax=Undibacterium sp. TaxID=1914977 RepID=UPI002B54288C|nr:flagellar protein FlgN [Undibacterium sp.]HTD05374.1 flagellar protein FlgN [Undibacterium sp.]
MNLTTTSLLECLQEETKAMTSLAELLEKEQAALVNGKVEELAQTTVNKTRVISDISALEKLRNKYLLSQGFADDAAGMRSWLQQVPAESETAKCWTELLAITAKANEKNRTNGILINRHMSVTQSALKILQQNDPAAGSFYGPSGHATLNKTSGRGFAAR